MDELVEMQLAFERRCIVHKIDQLVSTALNRSRKTVRRFRGQPATAMSRSIAIVLWTALHRLGA